MTAPPARLISALADRYRLERELGQGGMATVYLAQDLRHARRVALKVLRPELAAVIGAERFLAEIRTTANLQHPHILPLFDSGEAEGFLFYVMPLVEGESLRDRLNRDKQLPIGEAVRIATEVGSALDYAHRHNVIHRDIKPENILLHDGSALVADFGIALAASRAGGTRMTETGMSLGTPHYMSPEQAMGEREITARSDVYALGAVLYEMLTGEPPFTGPTAQAIVAKVVTEEPRPLIPKRHTIPPHVEAAVLTALEKVAADRFGSAAELTAALANPGFHLTGTTLTRAAAGPAGVIGSRRYWPVALGLLAGIVLGAGILWLTLPRPPAPPVSRYAVTFAAGQEPDLGDVPYPSPDGRYWAYVGPAPGGIQLWLKEQDRAEVRPIPGTEGVFNATWSPDGAWLAFTRGTELRKVPVQGGASVTIADTVSGNRGLAWMDDGTIIYVWAGGRGLGRVGESGGTAERIYLDSAQMVLPQPLPGGRGVLFTRCASNCGVGQELWVLNLERREARRLVSNAVLGWYLPTGDLLYVRNDGSVFAQRFDPGALETRGDPVPVMEGITVINGLVPMLALSASGTMVARFGPPLSFIRQYEMVWVDRAGSATPVDSGWTVRFTSFGANVGWSLSPDGRRLAIGLSTESGDDVWVKQLPRGPLSRVSYDSAAEFRPRWLPDGRTIMFGSNRPGEGTGGLYTRRADGTGADSLVLRAANGIFEGAWSPDGRWLVYRTGGTVAQVGGRDIVGRRPGVDTAAQPIVATPYDEEAIAISPDGRLIAYESDETGRTEIFLRPFPETQQRKWQVSNLGGVAPLWARNGRELYFVSPRREMMVVSVGPAPEPALGLPRVLFTLPDRVYMTQEEFYTPFDVAPDGRFIMARDVTPETDFGSRLIVTENWFTELRRLTER